MSSQQKHYQYVDLFARRVCEYICCFSIVTRSTSVREILFYLLLHNKYPLPLVQVLSKALYNRHALLILNLLANKSSLKYLLRAGDGFIKHKFVLRP